MKYYTDPAFWLWVILSAVVTGWVTFETTTSLETVENRPVINSIPLIWKSIEAGQKEMILLRIDTNANTQTNKDLRKDLNASIDEQKKLDERQWGGKDAVNP